VAKPGKSIDERGVVSHGALKDNEISKKILLRPASKDYFVRQLELGMEHIVYSFFFKNDFLLYLFS
jgi:hypothetical protein